MNKLISFIILLIISAFSLSFASGCIAIPIENGISGAESDDFSQFINGDTDTKSLQSDISDEKPIQQITSYKGDIAEYEYNIPKRYYSEGIKNIVKRSRQITELHWTPLKDITGFDRSVTFKAGTEVVGIPYGQPVYSGKFLCYGASFKDFREAVLNPNSSLYTELSSYEEVAPFYSIDCSAFVSYCWNMKNRCTADNLHYFGDDNGNKIDSIQVGDAIISVGKTTHAVLVTGVKEDEDNNVVWVEISEATPPITRVTRYGEGEIFSVNDLKELYFDLGYRIYRNTDFRDTKIPYSHNCASPLSDEKCELCNEASAVGSVSVENGEDFVSCRCQGDNAVAFAYTVRDKNFGTVVYRTAEPVKMMSTYSNGNYIHYTIPQNSLVTTTKTVTATNGSVWAMVRHGGHGGWINISDCEQLSGTLAESDLRTFEADKHSAAVINLNDSDLFDGCIVCLYALDKSGNRHEIKKIVISEK